MDEESIKRVDLLEDDLINVFINFRHVGYTLSITKINKINSTFPLNTYITLEVG